ncbi:MAG: methyltransferase, partial [Rickettsiaceae bacterium]|nr:methyltransferase [Rickettsiaceae bacterium]
MQHFSEDEQREVKLRDIIFLEEQNSIKIEFIKLKNSLRRKINLKFLKKNDRLFLGFFAPRSDKIININICPASEKELSEIISPISDLIDKNISDRDSGEIHILKADNGLLVQISLTSSSDIRPEFSRRLKSMIGRNNIISISLYLNNNLKISFNNQKKEPEDLSEEAPYVTFGSYKIEVEPNCFLQPTKESDLVISNFAINAIDEHRDKYGFSSPKKPLKILDLFCGRGTISIPLGTRGHNIDSYDFDDKALSALSKGSSDLPIRVHKRDLLYNPINDELAKYDFIIINPPRIGAEEQMKRIAKAKKENGSDARIVYIS